MDQLQTPEQNAATTMMRVFMVDDSSAICLRMQDLLTKENKLLFRYCTKGKEALAMAEEFAPTVILQDLIMPDSDGFELLRLYRKNSAVKNVPVIIFSGEKDPKVKAKAFSIGANDYIQKDDDIEELIARLVYHSRRYQNLLLADHGQQDLMIPTKHTVKVLMVDESRFACLMVDKMLSGEEDITFTYCIEPAKALVVAEKFLPTVIIQSLSLDDFTGMSRLRAFRSHPSTRDVPIIILSGIQDPKIKAQALESGANDYVVKSHDKEELISRLKSHSSEYYNQLKSRFSQSHLIQNTDSVPVKVLMIDDSKFFCVAIEQMIKTERNITFISCTDPRKALDTACDFAPTVILLDLEMPELTGFEVMTIFRDDPYTCDIPIIVLSGTTTSSIKAKVFASGANDYMEKKMDKIELISRIQYHTRGYINALHLKESMQNLMEAHKRLELQGNFIRKTFGRYLSDEIVSSILESPDGLELGGEFREISIMMSDLRGFTSLSEELPPEDVLAIINNFLKTMTEILQEFGGTIDEFIGDAILAMFGAPHAREDDAQRIVACAVKMQLAMTAVNQWNREHGYPEIAMGIGLHTGGVVVGNIGSEKRSKYGIVGRNVNLTSRIESYTLGGQIYCSERTRELCGPILRIDGQMEVMPKGVKQPITIYEIGGIGDVFNLYLPEKTKPLLKILTPPLPLKMTVLEGKHAQAESTDASLISLQGRDAEIETPVALEKMNNVKIALLDTEGNLISDSLYAKVMEQTTGSSCYRIHFTSLAKEAAAFLASKG